MKLPRGYDLGEINDPQVQTTVSIPVSGKAGDQYLLQADSNRTLYFSMAEREDADSMEAYLKKDNGQWMNLTEEGFALCSEDGLYVSIRAWLWEIRIR